MSTVNIGLRKAFAKPVPWFVKITPTGFHLTPQGVPLEPDTVDALIGRVTSARLFRKRFEDNVPVCHAKDGLTSDDGASCAECQHPDCRPWLRIRLAQPRRTCILDLNITSAQNFFAIEDQAAAQGERLRDWPLRLTVETHDRWAEVRFERFASTAPRPLNVSSVQPSASEPNLSGETEAGHAEGQTAEG